jgi:hypothetical protein
MKGTISSVWFLVAASLIGPALMVRGANGGAVSYANVAIRQRAQLISNPLSNRANRADEILTSLTSVPEGTKLAKFDGRNWLTNEYLQGVWTFPEMTLSPGEGALLLGTTNWTLTWVGAIPQGELKVWIPAGGSLRSSLVPQTGKLSELLQFPKVTGTKIYRVDDTGQFVLRATCTNAGWEPEEPTILAGESFYIEAPHEFVWNRAFVFDSAGGDSPTNTAIRILNQPRSQQISGEPLLLAVEATSTNGLYYQWQFNGNDIMNATEPTLFIPQASLEHVGNYWVNIWDGMSWVWSDIAVVQAASSSSPRLTIDQDQQRRGMVLISQGASGRNPVIEFSTDLVQWTELTGAESIAPDAVLDRSSSQAARFYRLRLD